GGLPTSWDTDGAADWRVVLTVTSADAVADFASTGAGSVAGTVTERSTGAAIPGAAVDCVWPGLDGLAGTADDVTFAATSAAVGLARQAATRRRPLKRSSSCQMLP